MHTIFKGIALCVPFLMISCNDKSELINEENETKVFFTVDKFESASTTRTTVDPTNNYAITWASGDVIGIFPREGYQEPFIIPADQVGKSNASFDGGYWALKEGLTYNAYYPFNKANFESAEMKTQIPVTYLGQEQEGATCGIGAYDYTYSDWAEATSSSVNFKFHHIGAFAIFTLEYPATATYTKLTLSANTAVIPTTGTYDLTAEEVNFVANDNGLATSISLTLKNCSGTAGETGIFYMMLPPMDLSSNKLAVTLTNSEGTSQSYSLESFIVTKGKKYELTCERVSNYTDGTAFVAKAGELSKTIPSDEKNTITSLKVEGILNGTDIKFLQQMSKENEALTYLDLSEAYIVKGGDSYDTYEKRDDSGECETSDNTIGRHMFRNCKFKTIILPNSVTKISSGAFAGCKNLTSITIPNNIQTIDFSGPTYSGNSVTFEGCPLTDIKLDDNNPYFSATNGVLFNKDKTKLLRYLSSDGTNNSYTIPETVTSIGICAFYKCANFTAINIPNSVTTIEEYAFYGCTNVTELTLSSNLTTIPNYAFSNCGYNTNATFILRIPEGITRIGKEAFHYVSIKELHLPSTLKNIDYLAFIANRDYSQSINSIYCSATYPPTFYDSYSEYWIGTNFSTCTLYVPKGSEESYANSSYWPFENIVGIDFQNTY